MKLKRVAQIGTPSGQGEVWRAVDENGDEYAVKYVKLPVAIEDVGTELKRFKREIKCQRQLDHPNILSIVAINLKSDKPFFVMPLASGSLRGHLAFRTDGFDEAEARTILEPVMEAIVYAHREGVVHRDIKPENILMFGTTPVVADFGLGRRLSSASSTITMPGVGLGTWAYSAPEQLINGHDGDERSDVYSIGRVMFEVFTGVIPFPRQDLSLVPDKFRHIVFTATRDKPEDRYASVAAMLHDFRLVANGYESLRSPAERIRSLLVPLAAGTGTDDDYRAVARLVIEHSSDTHLMDALVEASTEPLMAGLYALGQDTFEQVANAIARYAEGAFDYEFVDRVGAAIEDVYSVTTRVDIRTLMLQSIMSLGARHNRFHLRDRTIELLTEAVREETYVLIVTRLLHDNPRVKEFLRDRLGRHSLPTLIADELAA